MFRKVAPVLLAIAVASPAFGQVDLPESVTDGFYVTLQEIRANSQQVFDSFAGSSDGRISKNEFVSMELPADLLPSQDSGQLLQRLFGVLDADGDGHLTRAEWNEQIGKDLSFVDQNGDGRITLKELSNARENVGLGDAIGMIF
jgi:Ca2+-binding EF-hand superfamily protein